MVNWERGNPRDQPEKRVQWTTVGRALSAGIGALGSLAAVAALIVSPADLRPWLLHHLAHVSMPSLSEVVALAIFLVLIASVNRHARRSDESMRRLTGELLQAMGAAHRGAILAEHTKAASPPDRRWTGRIAAVVSGFAVTRTWI